jgi:hypothetical protein
VDGLLLVRGRIAVIHQREVDGDPIAEPGQLKVPVVPPARVLLAKQQHQQHRDEEDPDTAAGVPDPAASRIRSEAAALERCGKNRNRDDPEDPKRSAEAIEVAVGIVDREGQRVVVAAARRNRITRWGCGNLP